MALEFRPDVEHVRERWTRFWRGDSDRPLFRAIRPRAGVETVPRPRPYDLSAGDIERLWNTFTSRKLCFHVSPETLAELPW